MASQHRVRNIFGDVAEAIRAKKHIEGKLYPYDFADNIISIESPIPNIYYSTSLAPTDTTVLWVITAEKVESVSCAESAPQVLNAGMLAIVGGGQRQFTFLDTASYSVKVRPSAVYIGSVAGIPVDVTAALYDNDSSQWKTLSGDNYATVNNASGETVLVVGNYTVTPNGSGDTITIL